MLNVRRACYILPRSLYIRCYFMKYIASNVKIQHVFEIGFMIISRYYNFIMKTFLLVFNITLKCKFGKLYQKNKNEHHKKKQFFL